MSEPKSTKFDFESQFSMTKISFMIFIFVSVKIIRLLDKLIIKPFFDNFIFWSTFFSEIGPNFVNSWSSERKSNHKNN